MSRDVVGVKSDTFEGIVQGIIRHSRIESKTLIQAGDQLEVREIELSEHKPPRLTGNRVIVKVLAVQGDCIGFKVVEAYKFVEEGGDEDFDCE